MPQLGELKRGREIGKTPYALHIWSACIDCGKQRWVIARAGIARYTKCGKCTMKNLPRHRPEWRPSKYQTAEGYVLIKLHPDDFFYGMTSRKDYVLEHRLIMAKHLGRCLHLWELVRHKNTDKGNNGIENLQLISDTRHNQLTILQNKINKQAEKITQLEIEINFLKTQSKVTLS